MKRQDAAREQAETDRVKPGFALGGGRSGGWETRRETDTTRKTVHVPGYVINATVKGFARKCCATKICNLTRQGSTRRIAF